MKKIFNEQTATVLFTLGIILIILGLCLEIKQLKQQNQEYYNFILDHGCMK